MTDDERRLLWCQYFFETETHDREFPGEWDSRDRDVWIPRPEYRGAMLSFAAFTLERLGLDARDPLRKEVARLGYDGWRRALEEREPAPSLPSHRRSK